MSPILLNDELGVISHNVRFHDAVRYQNDFESTNLTFSYQISRTNSLVPETSSFQIQNLIRSRLRREGILQTNLIERILPGRTRDRVVFSFATRNRVFPEIGIVQILYSPKTIDDSVSGAILQIIPPVGSDGKEVAIVPRYCSVKKEWNAGIRSIERTNTVTTSLSLALFHHGS